MSSSKSVAAARNKRAEGPPPSKNIKPTGPITSINTSGGVGFNGVSSNAGAYARAQQFQQQQPLQSQQPQYYQQSHQQDQPIPSKVTIENAIRLLTVRIARLEQFVHRYNLEQPGSQVSKGSQGNSSDNVDARLDESIIRNIVTRLDNLEKDKKSQAQSIVQAHAQAHAQARAQMQPQPQVQVQTQPIAEDPSVIQLNVELSQLKQQVKETEALLYKLQSFTMDTNQKLVNMLFQDTNEISITQLNDVDYECEYDPSDTNEVFNHADNNTSMIEVLDDDIGATADAQTASGNLKDLINEELARLPV